MSPRDVEGVLAEIEAVAESEKRGMKYDNFGNVLADKYVPRLVAALRWAVKEAGDLGDESGQDWRPHIEGRILALLTGQGGA